MGLFLFAVHDTKVNCFAPPFTCRSKGEAIRSFTEEVKSANSMLHKYPADFRLYCVGEYDETQGIIQPRAPELVVGADEIGVV